ncbi:uncharacterized protein LOC120135392 [Hibiscus syriacus]|uniref:uncharacterized protein LOC120135392 n=1 Tax=Hibiscus syriacus TaxID=106335 RepID=UPI00192344E0|nr:uncharacterized protein LOC120135392 [Hibiscus syriacus]
MTKKPRPFKFFNCWTTYEKFLSTIKESWQGHCEGSAMQCLFSKLMRLKPFLKELNKVYFSDISGRVSNKRAELEQIQIFNLTHVDQRRIDDERRIHAELMDLKVVESRFYRQKAKIHWLREGDLNTRFFHQRVESNKKRNTIRVIKGEDGQCYDSFEGMAAELVIFFTNLIGSADPPVKGSSVESLKGLLNYSLPEGACAFLTKEVNDIEINEALFRQWKDKSPGPDDYTYGFFKAAWDIVGIDFVSAVRYFFQSSCLLPAFNATVFVLVPKSLNACLPKEFRHISFCSVAYKTITRILVNRLVPFFLGMISHSQSAFVKGRNIVDNTLLAQEVVKGYSRKSLSPRYAIKIDLQKAFDSNWNFLLIVLEAIGLLGEFCNWIKACITTLMYSVSLNVFFHGSLDVVLGVQSTIEKFYELSSLMLNALKTEYFACDLNEHVLEQIRLATGFRMGQLPVRYLGVPLVTRKLTGKDCAPLLVRIKDKLNQWSSKKLSFGGKLQLVKTVLFSICNYWSRQLILPKGIIRDIERLCMRFFWKGSDTLARGARVGWNQICSLKSEGGMGLRDLVVWSRACSSYWEVECKAYFSWILSKLLRIREEARRMFYPCANWNQIKEKWIWDNIRVRREKFSLISWMAILDRLPTKDRFVRFGLVIDNVCVVCGSGMESQDHLFAKCSYAKEVRGAVLISCGLRYESYSWDERFSWLIENLKGKSLRVRILKLAWTGFLYFIREERNHRHFRGLTRSVDVTVNRIKEAVKIKLYRHCMYMLDDVNRHLCINWGLN